MEKLISRQNVSPVPAAIYLRRVQKLLWSEYSTWFDTQFHSIPHLIPSDSTPEFRLIPAPANMRFIQQKLERPSVQEQYNGPSLTRRNISRGNFPPLWNAHFWTQRWIFTSVKPKGGESKSNIYSHSLDTAHKVNRLSFKIIFSSQNSSLRLVESIFIDKLPSPHLSRAVIWCFTRCISVYLWVSPYQSCTAMGPFHMLFDCHLLLPTPSAIGWDKSRDLS